jgi:UDP-2,3-diacylglucosamine pyrophosphatase LpxH
VRADPSLIRLVVSDLHASTGLRRGMFNPLEDFHADDKFAEFVDYYAGHARRGKRLELILNGDIFDLLKVPFGPSSEPYTDEITEEVAADKIRQALEGHPQMVRSLTSLLERGNTQITYIPGNHDIEMLLPSAQRVFRELVAPGSLVTRVRFIDRSDTYHLPEGIQIRHGHQLESIHRFDYKHLLGPRREGPPIVSLPWGSLMVLHVLIDAKKERYHVDHIIPQKRFILAALLMDFRFAARLVARMAFHFMRTRAFPKEGSIPTKLWEGLKVIAHELEPVGQFDDTARHELLRIRGVHTLVLGHSHEPRYWRLAEDKLYVNTGTWVKMININLHHLGQDTGMTYALIDYDSRARPRTTLYRWFGSYEQKRPVPY